MHQKSGNTALINNCLALLNADMFRWKRNVLQLRDGDIVENHLL